MDKLISINAASNMLGVSQNTLRSYGENGNIQEIRTVGGHRRYLLSDIQRLQGIAKASEQSSVRACCYCRVSSNDQKQHGDLDRQKLRLLEYCSQQGYLANHVFVEVCSGMKTNRPELNKVYELVANKEIDVLIIEHKDRLTRFMYDVFAAFFLSYGVKIVIVETDLPQSFENELVSDIMSLMTSFIATIHSRRKRQSKEYRQKSLE